MELNLIQQTIKITPLIAFLSALFAFFYFDSWASYGILLGAGWGCSNLWIIKMFLTNIFAKDKNITKLFVSFLLKFPVLYLIAYGFLKIPHISAISLIIGFGLIFPSFAIALFKNHFLKKPAQFLFPIILSPFLFASPLHAALDVKVPEVPNFITLLHHAFEDIPWIAFLHEYESLFFSLLVALTITLFFILAANKRSFIPQGYYNFVEWLVEGLRKHIIEIIGPKGAKFVPFLGTLFIYILIMNWFVLIPFMKAPSSSLNITAAMAICVFVLVQYLNIKHFGFLGFFYHLAGSPKTFIEWLLVPLMLPIEILTQLTRPVTLALRLFGNVVGEDILIGVFALFGVILLYAVNSPIGLPLQIPFMFLALLTSLMQALVFTLLSTIYIVLSMPHDEEHVV